MVSEALSKFRTWRKDLAKVVRLSYSRSAVVLCATLLIAIALVQSLIAAHYSSAYRSDVTLTARRDMARELVTEIGPNPDLKEVIQKFRDYMHANPNTDIFLIDKLGVVQTTWLDDKNLRLPFINTKPLKQFLADPAQGPLLLGDDPRQPEKQKPFSVATLKLGNDISYVYILFGRESTGIISAVLKDTYLLRIVIGVFFVTAIFCAVVILFAWTMIARRLQAMNATMANMSHDLRAPLASIQGYIETALTKNDSLSADERKGLLSVALRNTLALSNLINDFFDLSKMEGLEDGIHREQFSLGDLASDTVLKFYPIAAGQKVELSMGGDPIIPLTYGNVALIERALSNLIDNGIRHTPSGGKVCVFIKNHKDYVRVQVSDTGSGIPEHELEHIFERAFSGKEGRQKGGTGLGLSITKRIIDIHNGRISVKSKLGEGTMFEIELPALKQRRRLNSLP